MPFIDDRLTPRDGLNDYTIAFARMQPQPQSRGGAEFVFAISESMKPVCELGVVISSRGQGLDQMMVEAHELGDRHPAPIGVSRRQVPHRLRTLHPARPPSSPPSPARTN